MYCIYQGLDLWRTECKKNISLLSPFCHYVQSRVSVEFRIRNLGSGLGFGLCIMVKSSVRVNNNNTVVPRPNGKAYKGGPLIPTKTLWS